MYKIYKQCLTYGENILSQNSLNRYSVLCFFEIIFIGYFANAVVYYSIFKLYIVLKCISFFCFFSVRLLSVKIYLFIYIYIYIYIYGRPRSGKTGLNDKHFDFRFSTFSINDIYYDLNAKRTMSLTA